MMIRTLILVAFLWGRGFPKESTTDLIDIFTKKGTLTSTLPSAVANTAVVSTRTPGTGNYTTTAANATGNKLFIASNATTNVPKYCVTNTTTGTNQTDCVSVPAVTTSSPGSNKKVANTTATTVAPKKVEKKGKIVKKNYDNDKEVCSCDLQLDICDINCCCDRDCSEENKEIFKYCHTDKNRYYDSRYCDYMEYIYVNNTPLEWQVNQNGLFCIVKSNMPPSSVVQRKQPLESYRQAQLEKTEDAFSWRTESVVHDESFSVSQKFVYGNPIWTVTKNEDILKFRLPKNFYTPPCIYEEDVFLLKNTKHDCSQVDISEENRKLSFENYFQNFKIISAANSFNVSKFKKDIFKECPKNVCLEVEPKICEDFFKNCSNISLNNTQINFTCNFNLLDNKNYCKNAVKKLRYDFRHDGTKGFKKVEVLAVLQNFSYEFHKTGFNGFFQEFSVNFLWLNQTDDISKIFSGNPGYIIDKPILIATKHKVVNSTHIIVRNSTKITDNFLTLPKQANRKKCALNETEHLLVEFGYNLFGKCDFSEQIFYNKSLNFTASEICRNFQIKIFNLWRIFSINESIVVGSFGNANPNILDDWVEVLFESTPEHFLRNYTAGNFSENNKTLSCYNISTGLSIDVFHSRIDFEHLLNQEKILGVAFTFQESRNFSFEIRDGLKNVSFFDARFKMEQTVVFHDLTTEKSRTFFDPPSFDIKLPYDFFYPFVKVDNGVNNGPLGNVFVFSTCLIFVSFIF